MRKLKLPKNRITGLYVYCNGCKTYYSSDSKINCKCDKLIYKAKIHVPGTKRECRTRALVAANYKDAVRELLEFINELKAVSFQKPKVETESGKPFYLLECMDTYMSFLRNEGVPLHKQKVRSKRLLTEFDRFFRYLIDVAEKNKINAAKLTFEELDDKIVAFLDEYATNELKYKNKTYNNLMTGLCTFVNYIAKEYYPEFKNPFKGVKRNVVVKVVSIPIKQFVSLMEIVNQENGYKHTKTRGKENMFRSWIKEAFMLSLFTGGRSEEVVEMKWNGIRYDDENDPIFIEIPDYKVSRTKSTIRSVEDYKMKRVVVTSEFKELLLEMGYEKYKDTDRHILAPDCSQSRTDMRRFMSESFTHYFKLLNTGTERTIKHLRKTYSTAARKEYGQLANIITNHADNRILDNHYIDQEEVIKDANKNFNILKRASEKNKNQ